MRAITEPNLSQTGFHAPRWKAGKAPLGAIFLGAIFFLIAIFIGGLGVSAPSLAQTAIAQNAAGTINGVRIGQHEGYTRLVLDLSIQAPYRLLTLGDPNRVVIDLPEVVWSDGNTRKALGPLSQPNGVIGQFRFGLFQPGVSRFVLDLAGTAVIARHFRLPPTNGVGGRLVLDLQQVNALEFSAAPRVIESEDWAPYLAALRSTNAVDQPRVSDSNNAPQVQIQSKAQTQAQLSAPLGAIRAPLRLALQNRTAAAISPNPQLAPKPAKPARRIIVLDAGHGGVDPGAIGASGVYEKNVVLQFVKDFRAVLEGSGRYRVVLTRDRDVYVKLRDRYEVAHNNNAELFISVHADAHSTSKLRGLSVYTLSETASDKEAAALAAKENKSDILAGYDLTGYDDQTAFILLDLAQRKTSESSWKFAQTLVSNMEKGVQLLRRPHRFAGFAVLKSPTVPSVLIELGYLSNKYEEEKLKSADYRKTIGRSLLQAIDRYFAEQEELNRS